MWGCDRLYWKKIFQTFENKNDENGRFLILEAMIDGCVFILINLYNRNTENEQVSTREK